MTKGKRKIAYAFIDRHPAMPEPDRMLAFAQEQNSELVKALEDAESEIYECIQWATIEKAPLRDQEIESLRSKLAVCRAALTAAKGGKG